MAKSDHSDDESRLEVVKDELEKFSQIVKGHRKSLDAIGKM